MQAGTVSAYFKEELMRGNVHKLVATELVVRLVGDNEVELQLLDEHGHTLVRAARTRLEVGSTLTVTQLEKLFDITVR